MSKNIIFSHEFRKDAIQTTLSQISKGESTSLVGMPGVGKTNAIKWISHYAANPKSNIFLVVIDLNNLVSVEDIEFYRLILLEVNNAAHAKLTDTDLVSFIKDEYNEYINSRDQLLTFNALKRITKRILDSTGQKVCILFDGFEKVKELSLSFFNTLNALRDIDKIGVVYIFFTNQDISLTFTPEKTGGLYYLLNYNKKWLIPLDKEESYNLIDEFAELLSVKVTPEMKEKIFKYTGGHAWYIKVLTKLYGEKQVKLNIKPEELSNLGELETRANQIWAQLDLTHKDIIFSIVQGDDMDPGSIPEYLLKSQVIKYNDGKFTLFSPLFKEFVKAKLNPRYKKTVSFENRIQRSGLEIDVRKRMVLLNGKSLNVDFTKAEFNLLKYFFDREGMVVSRDDVAKSLWGENSMSKYSDWAIDKTISRLREKIELNPKKPKYLATIRGVGFKFLRKSDI